MANLTFDKYVTLNSSLGKYLLPVFKSDTNFNGNNQITGGRLNAGGSYNFSMGVTLQNNTQVNHCNDFTLDVLTAQYDSSNKMFTIKYNNTPVATSLVSPSARYPGAQVLCFVSTPDNKTYFSYVQLYGYSNARFTWSQASTSSLGLLVFDVLNNITDLVIGKSSQTITENIYNNASELSDDPYAGAGDSTTGGGDGTFDGSSDPVPVPSLPSVGATDTGFITLFVPTRAQLKQVAQYMWGGLFDVSTWKRLFEDPMDCILGLSVVPVTVPATASGNITVGNIELSGISLPIADQQYIELDCGTIDFSNRYFGSYLDFEPYTKMSLFVPYSGVHSVSADDIIGKIVGLKYHIDILTGSLVAFLTCGDSVLYEFNGACASNIPVNSMNYASTIENAIRIAVNIGTTVATAGASAPVQGISQAQQTARNIGTGISLAGSTTEGALSLKPNIDRAGSLGGTTGLMGNQIPYFIITRPRLCKPKNQDFFQGYPSFIQTSVGDLIGKGFTSFTNIIIAESFMTDAENEELETILQGGVYL